MAEISIRTEVAEFLLGVCGAVIAEALHWHRIARQNKWPKYAKRSIYWILTSLIILGGGVIAAAVSGPGTSPLQLMLLGIVGPQLLQATARARVPQRSTDNDDVYLGPDRSSISEFMAL